VGPVTDRGRERWEGKTVEELLSDLLTVAEVDSVVHRQIQRDGTRGVSSLEEQHQAHVY
jgi:hypothetical protein